MVAWEKETKSMNDIYKNIYITTPGIEIREKYSPDKLSIQTKTQQE
jgi:hypothetical protein